MRSGFSRPDFGGNGQTGGAGEFGLALVEGEEGIGAEDEGGGDVEDVQRAGGGLVCAGRQRL